MILLTLGSVSCSTFSSSSSSSSQDVYQLDLHGYIDGTQWSGIAVGSDASKHTIQIISDTDVNYMTIQSCHRFDKFEDVISNGWFHHDRGFQYEYDEAPGIEDTGECILRLSAFSKQVGAGQAFGLLIFKNKKFNAPARDICNGSNDAVNGTAVCQSEKGLMERLQFNTQMIAASTVGSASSAGDTIPGMCQGRFIDATTWQYEMPLGECVAVFGTAAPPYQYFILFAYGFNKTQYRGDQ